MICSCIFLEFLTGHPIFPINDTQNPEQDDRTHLCTIEKFLMNTHEPIISDRMRKRFAYVLFKQKNIYDIFCFKFYSFHLSYRKNDKEKSERFFQSNGHMNCTGISLPPIKPLSEYKTTFSEYFTKSYYNKFNSLIDLVPQMMKCDPYVRKDACKCFRKQF